MDKVENMKTAIEDDLGAFEATLSFLLHWGSRLLVTFPHPPVPILVGMELVLRRTDRELSDHLESLTVGAFSYGWPLLRSALSVVLSREDWRRLMDRIIADVNRPELLEAAVVGFVVASRARLLACRSTSEAEGFFQQPQPSVAVDEMFRVMEKVSRFGPPERWSRERVVAEDGIAGGREAGNRRSKRLSGDVDGTMAALALLRTAPREFEPLAAGFYPRFEGYPKCVVNYQAKMREMVVKQGKEEELKRRLVQELAQRARFITDDQLTTDRRNNVEEV